MSGLGLDRAKLPRYLRSGSGNGSYFHMDRAPPAFPRMNLPATLILQHNSSSSFPLDPRGVGISGCQLARPSFLHLVLLELEVNICFLSWLASLAR